MANSTSKKVIRCKCGCPLGRARDEGPYCPVCEPLRSPEIVARCDQCGCRVFAAAIHYRDTDTGAVTCYYCHHKKEA